MNIYVSKGLEQLGERLKERGYNIVTDESTPCDAIICDLKNSDLYSMNQIKNVKREGTLIIDFGSKSLEDIDYILNNRNYNSIF